MKLILITFAIVTSAISIITLQAEINKLSSVTEEDPNNKILRSVLDAQEKRDWQELLVHCSARVKKNAEFKNTANFEASFYIKESLKYTPTNCGDISRLRTYIIADPNTVSKRCATIFKVSGEDNKNVVLYAELVFEDDRFKLDKIFPSPISRLFYDTNSN